MRTLSLVYSIAALAAGMTLTNYPDGSAYTAPLPPDKSFSVNIGNPVPGTLPDGTPGSYVYINISGIDMTKLGFDNSYSLPVYSTDTNQTDDLAEVFIGNIFAQTGILPALQFPAPSTGFLTEQGLRDKYNLNNLPSSTSAPTAPTAPTTPTTAGSVGSPPSTPSSGGCCD